MRSFGKRGGPRCARWRACRGVCGAETAAANRNAPKSRRIRGGEAEPRGGTKLALLDKFEKLGVLLVNAQHLVGMARFGLGKPIAPGIRAAGSSRPESARHGGIGCRAQTASRAAAQPRLISVLEPFGFFVRTGPLEADHIREEFFRETMPQNQCCATSLPFGAELNVAVASHPQIAAQPCASARR